MGYTPTPTASSRFFDSSSTFHPAKLSLSFLARDSSTPRRHLRHTPLALGISKPRVRQPDLTQLGNEKRIEGIAIGAYCARSLKEEIKEKMKARRSTGSRSISASNSNAITASLPSSSPSPPFILWAKQSAIGKGREWLGNGKALYRWVRQRRVAKAFGVYVLIRPSS
ncbi:hypothetical protein BHM03_00016489 [Ensete ventricosum]|nr:hypothetical protein BHM03_00016489 [Ensete ventricosum]